MGRIKINRKTKFILLLNFGIIILAICLLLFYGVIWPNNLFINKYKIRGIDVSNHQKKLDWQLISKNKNIKFAYIKATEGDDFRDKYFKLNWESASKVRLIKGAYHYFTVKSSGKMQAKNFINTVPNEKNTLPPVIDIEENGISKERFRQELENYITLIENRYHQEPIIYTVYDLYNEYLIDNFKDYKIWIRDILKYPSIDGGKEWVFWQYHNRGHLDGCKNYIDLNVFYGNLSELNGLCRETKK